MGRRRQFHENATELIGARASKLCARYTSPTTIGQQISITASVRNQDDGSNFLVSRGGGVVLSRLSVCRLVLGRWLARLMAAVIGSGCNSCPFLPLPLTLSLSDQLPNEERKEGENKFVFESSSSSPSSRSCSLAASYAFPASNSCCCYTERGGVVARNDISEGKSQKRRPYLMKELCGSYHCLIAIRTNTLFCH